MHSAMSLTFFFFGGITEYRLCLISQFCAPINFSCIIWLFCQVFCAVHLTNITSFNSCKLAKYISNSCDFTLGNSYFDCDNIRKSVIIAVIILFARHITLFFTRYPTCQLHIFNSSVHVFVYIFLFF